MNLIIVRHVETEANIKRIFSGWSNYDITQNGLNQINELKKTFKYMYADYVISSPLYRAYYTALEISKVINTKIVIDERIKEINFGIFDGKTIEEIKEKYYKEYILWMGNYKKYCFPNGECYSSFFKRIDEFLNDLDKTKKYIIVTHGGVINYITGKHISLGDYMEVGI
ncbi:histidine phosphatase family protein [Marinitoga aeolica]|uniref:Histidine phosphatase family protein n=1 Tax=Marinitoga aeolica TaxID=2809031 RepID=A0ABY8PT28_9BACT|nr:histidine phosphatase family protein [Marinitoga aeolica]WGS65772.1 histidine phosphatase family protein [Marinitoga aeolica]